MNETTRTLLLKTRKGATSSFGPKQWKEVLEALGAQVQVEKTRNTVTKVVVRVPDASDIHGIQGFTLVIEKEPEYRRITFYKLNSFLKDSKFDLVELASKALGLATPAEEKRLNDLYVRDLTNTGTCAVCEGNFKRGGTGLVHHGFIRPGDGVLHGSCFGVGRLPWELSPQGAEDYLVELHKALEFAHKSLESLPQQEKMVRVDEKYNLTTGRRYTVLVEITRAVDSTEFERLLAASIRETEHRIEGLGRDIKYFTTKVANWKPDELPEFKYGVAAQKM
jgi:hypothetical protein